MTIKFVLNGKNVELEAEPEIKLLDVLRDQLHLKGTKEACGEGLCGSCTVLINGKTRLACLTPVVRANGKEITTIEGLNKDGVPDYIQQAFIDADAIQCGFCTPGLILAVKSYVEEGGKNDRETIKRAIAGNLCRCTGYSKVIEAVGLAIEYKDEDKTV